MNATGISLSWEALGIAVTGIVALLSYIIWFVRDQAQKEFSMQCEKDRNDDQDILLERHDTRLAKHENDMHEFRTTITKMQESTNTIVKEVSANGKSIKTLMQGMHNWWRDSTQRINTNEPE